MKPDDGLIAALATPLGQSALAVIRTSGPACISAIAHICRNPTKVLNAQGHTMLRAVLLDQDGVEIDDVMLGIFVGPRSYTGEDSVEIYCHGSLPGIERIFSALFRQGFRQAQGGEFTLRAFLNGKLDLTKAEAVQELVSSRSKEAHLQALHRLGGAVTRRINEIKTRLVRFLASVSVQLDYAEDEVDMTDFDGHELVDLAADLASLEESYNLGQRYQHGVRLALAGKTNAGKSSLFNALVREDRAIVSDVHGTTRDYLEAQLVLNGIPVRLYDTAGLRETDELVEHEGIRRSSQVIESAAVMAYVIDGSIGMADEDRTNLERYLSEVDDCVIVWNKIDLLESQQVPHHFTVKGRDITVCGVSAANLGGFDQLHRILAAMVRGKGSKSEGELLIDSERQHRLLARARLAIVTAKGALDGGFGLDAMALDVQDALGALGEITGEVTSDDVLEVMFSGFCVGK